MNEIISYLLPVVIGWLVLAYGWALWKAVSDRAPADRWTLLRIASEAVVIVVAARMAIAWTPLTGWIWVAVVGVLGALIALAAAHLGRLPWSSDATPRWQRVLTPPYTLGLVALSAHLLLGLA